MDTSLAVLLAAGTFVLGLLLGKQSGPSPAQPPAPIDPKALELARQVMAREGKIGAIKSYREATGVGLRDAKHAVDSLDQR